MLRVQYVLLALVFLPTMRAEAVFVLRKGESEPIVGYLVSENARQVVVRVDRGESERKAIIPREQIDELVHTVNPERLASLSPDNPQAYREYAEELTEMKADPEARDTARRLFVIGAGLDAKNQARSALLGLAELARSPEEEAAIRGAAYLLDPMHERSVLLPWQTAKVEPVASADASDEVLKALAHARHGDFAAARRVVETSKGKAQFAQVEAIFPRREFLAACTAGKLTDDQLRRLLSAELALLRGGGSGPRLEATGNDWSRALRTKSGLAAVPATSLRFLTEFDPQESVYRDGKWQRP